MIQFGRETCGHLDAALRREWLETNALGGFASSTVIGLNTRRYHGLLVAATKPPSPRLYSTIDSSRISFTEVRRLDAECSRRLSILSVSTLERRVLTSESRDDHVR